MTPSFLNLRTLGDPDLIQLEAKCLEWFDRFIRNDRPCWLTLCGNSDTGKTHCAKAIWREAKRLDKTFNKPPGEYFTRKIWWPGFVNELRAGKAYEELADSFCWNLMVIDEIGASRDSTGFVADQLYTILAQRDKNWTVITTNLPFSKLAETDERIASRCIRNDGMVVELNCPPFSTRKV